MLEVSVDMKTRARSKLRARARSKPHAAPPPPKFRAVGVSNVQIRNLLLAGGVSPAEYPPEPFCMLRPREAMRILGITKSSFYRRVRQGLITVISLDGGVASSA
jgi:hypothetical protein